MDSVGQQYTHEVASHRRARGHAMRAQDTGTSPGDRRVIKAVLLRLPHRLGHISKIRYTCSVLQFATMLTLTVQQNTDSTLSNISCNRADVLGIIVPLLLSPLLQSAFSVLLLSLLLLHLDYLEEFLEELVDSLFLDLISTTLEVLLRLVQV